MDIASLRARILLGSENDYDRGAVEMIEDYIGSFGYPSQPVTGVIILFVGDHILSGPTELQD